MVSLKRWFHCLASESKGRLLVNIILLFGSVWCHDANPVFFNKKTKGWTSRLLANPPPPMADNISFLPYPHAPSKWTSYMYHSYFNEIMESIASIKDRDMDYLVWNMFFFIKLNNSSLGLNPVALCQWDHGMYCINNGLRYGPLGLNHVIFFDKIQ